MVIGRGWRVAAALSIGDAGMAPKVVALSDFSAGGSDVLLAPSPALAALNATTAGALLVVRRGRTRSTPDRDDETVDRSLRSPGREQSSKLRRLP